MARLSTYGAPTIGNEFTILPAARPVIVSRPVAREEKVQEDYYLDESVLDTVEIGSIHSISSATSITELKKHTWLAKISVVLLLVAVLLISSWVFVAPRYAQTSSTPAVAAATKIPIASLATITNQRIYIVLNGKTLSPVPSAINNWVSNDITDGSKLAVNEDAIRAYISEQATPYTKETLNKIVSKDAGGHEKVLAQGKDGVKVDVDKAVNIISSNLLYGKGMNINLPAVAAPAKTVTTSDFDKLIEVDVTTHRMHVYENGSEVKTILVSAGAPDAPTPIGQYKILRKLAVQDMRGTRNGHPYFQPNVKWVSYFIDENSIAIHGNDWRPASIFGTANTSVGCVGMTNDNAKWIFDWAPNGTTVVVHS